MIKNILNVINKRFENFLDEKKAKPAIIIVFILYLLSALIALLYGGSEKFRQVGDSFGVLASLFTGLAFVIVYFAFVTQKKELEILIQSHKEDRESQDALERRKLTITLLNEWSEVRRSLPINADPAQLRYDMYNYLRKYMLLIQANAVDNSLLQEIITADMKSFKNRIELAKKKQVAGRREMMEVPDEEFEKVKSMFFPDSTT